jgi:hypothetical protein
VSEMERSTTSMPKRSSGNARRAVEGEPMPGVRAECGKTAPALLIVMPQWHGPGSALTPLARLERQRSSGTICLN